MDDIASSATRVPGLRKRVMVDLDRLSRVGEELRTSIPSDILEAKEIVKQRESIINQTQLEAQRLRDEVQQEAQALRTAAQQEQESRIDETEIVRSAEAKAQEINQQALQEAQLILQDAKQQAHRILERTESVASNRREGADRYARETLFALEERIAALLGQVRRGIDALGVEVEANTPS